MKEIYIEVLILKQIPYHKEFVVFEVKVSPISSITDSKLEWFVDWPCSSYSIFERVCKINIVWITTNVFNGIAKYGTEYNYESRKFANHFNVSDTDCTIDKQASRSFD